MKKLNIEYKNLALTLSLLLIAISIFYYLVIFLPSVESKKQQTIETNKKLQEDCLRESTNKLQTILGGSDPTTTNQQWIDTYLKVHESQKDDCYKRFSTDL